MIKNPFFEKYSKWDLFSLSLILLFTLFNIARFRAFPQFIDCYYHLSVSKGFIQAGGWVDWAFWDFAPFGRPHLYPPFYHLILVLLQKTGFSGLSSLKIAAVLILPLFFFVLWKVNRELFSDRFSFLTILIALGFFSFYASVTAQIPAAISLVFGLISWLALKRKRWLAMALSLTLSFYTHTGVSLIFLGSVIFLSLFDRHRTKLCLKALCLYLFSISPLAFHQIRYLKLVYFHNLMADRFMHINIVIVALFVLGLFFALKKKGLYYLFIGTALSSLIVFFRYPHRLFSAQGALGFIFLSALTLEQSLLYFKSSILRKILFSFILLYFFLFSSTIDLKDGKIKFSIINSTYRNLVKPGDTLFEFASFLFPKFYSPIVKIIKEKTHHNDIVYSNMAVTSQIFSSLSNRFNAKPIFVEVKPRKGFHPILTSKIIIWIKLEQTPAHALKVLNFYIKRLKFEKLLENDVFIVYKNPQGIRGNIIPAKIPFIYIYPLIFVSILLLILDLRQKDKVP